MADELITSNHRRFTNIPIRMHEATALLYHFCFCLGVADGRKSRPQRSDEQLTTPGGQISA